MCIFYIFNLGTNETLNSNTSNLAAQQHQNNSHNHNQNHVQPGNQQVNSSITGSSTTNADKNEGVEPYSEKLIPFKLERTENCLEEAIKFLKPLQSLAKNRLETHLMAFEIYYRKEKVLLMLQSLKRAVKIDANHPVVHRQLVLFYDFVKLNREKLCSPIAQVVNMETERVLGIDKDKYTTAFKLTENFLHSYKDNLVHRLECLKALSTLQRKRNATFHNRESLKDQQASSIINSSPKMDNNFDNLTNSDDDNKLSSPEYLKSLTLETLQNLTTMNDVTIKSCADLLECLKEGVFGSFNENIITQVTEQCHQLFTYATLFKPKNVVNNCHQTSEQSNMNCPGVQNRAKLSDLIEQGQAI